jgi:hypothetical protein
MEEVHLEEKKLLEEEKLEEEKLEKNLDKEEEPTELHHQQKVLHKHDHKIHDIKPQHKNTL